MRVMLFIICVSLISTLCACSTFSNNPMPTSTAYVENTDIKIPVKVFTYHWRGENEYGDSSAIEMKIEPTIVPPNSKIIFSFDSKPKKMGSIHEVLNEKDVIVLDNTKNEILVPYTNGIHTYSYNAQWPEGGVVFVFKVEVK